MKLRIDEGFEISYVIGDMVVMVEMKDGKVISHESRKLTADEMYG